MSFSDTRLRVFHSVARNLSFTRAAEELFLTQPAVTFQIRQLEEHFNTRLFDRHHNRITLTEAGVAAYQYADRILELYQETEKAVFEMTGETRGIIKLGVTTTPGEYLLPKILIRFHDLFPNVRIRVTTNNTLQVIRRLGDGTIDLGMVEGPVSEKKTTVAPCLADELVLICTPDHPLAQMEEVPFPEMKKYPFASREEGSGTRAIIVEHLASKGIDYQQLDIAMELGTSEAVKAIVSKGAGFGIVSRISLRKELTMGTLVYRRIRDLPLYRSINFVYRQESFSSKAVEEFLNFARQQCADIPPES